MTTTQLNLIPGFVAALGVVGLSLVPAIAAEPENPQVLPKMTVSAGVPLIKVAEYQMREPRLAPAAVAHHGFIYIISGLGSDGAASNTVERFEVRTGQSEIVARLRVARLWHRAILVGEKIYVLGGATPGRLASNTARAVGSAAQSGKANAAVASPQAGLDVDLESSVEIIDLATGTVSNGPAMTEARDQFACVQVGGQIFVIGGQRRYQDKASFTNTTEILDLTKNEWRRGVPMPTPREADGAIVDGGFIVVAGGYNGKSASDAVEVFDPRASAWRTIAPLVRTTSAHATVFLGNHLFLFGDFASPERLLAYNLKTKTSETFTLGYTAARHAAAVVADGRIYVIGGRVDRETAPQRAIQVFAPVKTAERRP